MVGNLWDDDHFTDSIGQVNDEIVKRHMGSTARNAVSLIVPPD